MWPLTITDGHQTELVFNRLIPLNWFFPVDDNERRFRKCRYSKILAYGLKLDRWYLPTKDAIVYKYLNYKIQRLSHINLADYTQIDSVAHTLKWTKKAVLAKHFLGNFLDLVKIIN